MWSYVGIAGGALHASILNEWNKGEGWQISNNKGNKALSIHVHKHVHLQYVYTLGIKLREGVSNQ